MEKLNSLHVLVTGGAGFIGSHIVDRLMRMEFAVTVVDNLYRGKIENIQPWFHNPRLSFLRCDLKDYESIREIVDGVDVIFHLAANSDVREAEKDPITDFNEDLIVTLNVLEAMRGSARAKTIVYFSSSTVYGEPLHFPTPEEYTPLLPISVYGASKLGGEAIISAYCHSSKLRGLVLRLANIIGGRAYHGVIVDFIHKLQESPMELEVLGDGYQKKSYLHVNDCIDAVFLAFHKFMHSKRLLEIYNIGSSDMLSVRDIAKIVIEEMQLRDVKLRFTGGVDGGRGWKGDVKRMFLNTERISRLGWRPRFNSEEAVRQSCHELLENLNHKTNKTSISVIIPTFNEELGIGKVLSEMPEGLVDEVIVVDSSTDDTSMIARKLGAKVVIEPRKGYGRALQTGIEKAKGNIIVYIDGDYTYDPKEISSLIQPILDGKCDVELGNRLNNMMLPGSMSPSNIFGNLILSLIFDILFLKRLTDTQSGFRAIRKTFLKGMSQRNFGMPYVTEQLIKLIKKGARIDEVPITYRPRIGETKLCRWTDGFKILKVILKERFM